jgi:hypothetical protein
MTAATNNGEITQLRQPGFRCYSLTASDTNTFTPSGVTATKAFAVYDEDPATGNPIGCTVSSGEITINCTGMSDVDILCFVVCED